MTEFTLILQRLHRGDAQAAADLLALVYDDLRALAAAKMAHELPGHTLQPTALVHEAWLRLGGEQQPAWQNRAHFFGAAGEAMRRILIDRARSRRAVRHGGGQVRVDLADVQVGIDGQADDLLLAIHEALEAFEAEHPEKARLVKLRFFIGMTSAEAAHALGIAEPTAMRWWGFARAWLHARIHQP